MLINSRLIVCALLALPVLAGCGATEEEVSPRAEVKAAHKAELPPLPKPRPKLSEPVAGQTRDARTPRRATTGAAAPEDDAPKPTGPASGTLERTDAPSAINGGTQNATALDNGVALPPLEAPDRRAQDHRGGQRDRAHALQVGRRPRPLPRHRLRLLRLGLLRALRRGADRRPERRPAAS